MWTTRRFWRPALGPSSNAGRLSEVEIERDVETIVSHELFHHPLTELQHGCRWLTLCCCSPKAKKFPCAVAAYSASTLLHVKQLEVRREGIKALSCLRRQHLRCSQAMQCCNDRIPLDGSPGVLTACASLRTSTMKRYNALWKSLEVAASAAGELLTKAEAEAWLRRAMCRQ